MNIKEEFIEKHLDELTGLLLASLSLVDIDPQAAIETHRVRVTGMFMRKTIIRARNLLGRLYDDAVIQFQAGKVIEQLNGKPVFNFGKERYEHAERNSPDTP